MVKSLRHTIVFSALALFFLACTCVLHYYCPKYEELTFLVTFVFVIASVIASIKIKRELNKKKILDTIEKIEQEKTGEVQENDED